MYYIDTHCHYDLKQFQKNRWKLLWACRVNRIEKIIVPAILPESNRSIPALLDVHAHPQLLAGSGLTPEQLPQLFFAAGIHPARLWHPSSIPEKEWEHTLREAAQSERCVAIGEIGLDYHLPLSPEQIRTQKHWFHRQLELAEEMQLPVILHIRDAAEDALSILSGHPLSCGGVVHCFCNGWSAAEQYGHLGLRLGLGGAVTRDGLEPLREAVQRLPAGSFVLETDGPYVKPQWLGRGPNSSLSIPGIARFLAQLRQVSIDEIAAQTTATAETLFRI